MRTPQAVAALLCLSASALHAQGTEWARLTIGVAIGLRTTASLWDIPNQPVLSASTSLGGPIYPSDLFHLNRQVRGGITFAASATQFTSPHVGLTIEFVYLGLRFHDTCILAHDGGDPDLASACRYVGSDQKFGAGINSADGYHDATNINQSGSTTVVQGGLVVRPFKPAALQPFFKVLVGFAATPMSTIAMASTYGAIADTSLNLIIYQDYGWKTVRPVGTLGVGFATAPASGLQFHAELRETFLTQSIVNGPTATQNIQPPSRSPFKGYPSVLIGLDLVLKRVRAKRY
jgi:hypothetical protein